METGLGRTLSDIEFDQLWKEQYESFTIKQPNGSYEGKSDFAHMMYIIAASCVDDNAKGVKKSYPNALASIDYGMFWKDSETRKKYTGWLGDATFTGLDHSGISFRSDDYAADLDADNIRRRMEKDDISFMQASAAYYSEMKVNPKLRTQEFKQNNPFEDVKKAVLDAAGVKNIAELKKKDGWSDSYNFLVSLANDYPDMQYY